MTTHNNAAQAAGPDFVTTELCGIIDVCEGSPTAIVSIERMRLWLSKLRAPVADERAAFEQAMRETYRMVDPLKPPPAGSYARGEHEGIIAALKTVRENFTRAALASAPVARAIQWPTMPASKGQSPVLFEDGYAEGWAKCMDECRRAVSQASAPVAGEALFWYRPRSDGSYEGPIHNDMIENLRKQSGAWVPLVPSASAAAKYPEGWRCADCGSYVLEPIITETRAPDKWVDDALDSAAATAEVLDGSDEYPGASIADTPQIRRALEGMLAVFACGAPKGESPTIDAARAALASAPVAGEAQEHYDEVKATLQGAHRIMEGVSAIERRAGPIGSHARGYTHKITNALRHLDALYAAPQAPAGWRWTLHPAGLHPDVYAAAAARDSAEPVVRYCPGCGRIGPVEGKYRDCCPDGNEARMIPVALAEKCRDTFRIAVKVLLADAAANDSGAPQASADTENCGLCGRKQLVNTAPTAAKGSEDDMLTIAYLAGAQAEKERAALADRQQRDGYAGVTVWVGNRKATQVVTRECLDLSNVDELLECFQTARAALSDRRARHVNTTSSDVDIDRQQRADDSALWRALAAASNYIDTLGGDSKSYRAALSATQTEQGERDEK